MYASLGVLMLLPLSSGTYEEDERASAGQASVDTDGSEHMTLVNCP